MKVNTLADKTAKLGYPLLWPGSEEESAVTLAEVVKSNDIRLWEGFPVMLARAAEKKEFDYQLMLKQLSVPKQKIQIKELVLLSLALYQAMNLKFNWAYELLKNELSGYKKTVSSLAKKLKENAPVFVVKKELSPERLKKTFMLYFKEHQESLGDFLSKKEEFGIEYALSQVFSPKQKELFLKKLKGEKLSKTESEYFSRTVKKKSLALANSQLHRLAQLVSGA